MNVFWYGTTVEVSQSVDAVSDASKLSELGWQLPLILASVEMIFEFYKQKRRFAFCSIRLLSGIYGRL